MSQRIEVCESKSVTGATEQQGEEFVSLRESLDTTTPGDKLVFYVLGTVAEFERDLILEQTTTGLEVTKAKGRYGGRPWALDEGKAKLARRLMDEYEGEHSVEESCPLLGIRKFALYGYFAEGVQVGREEMAFVRRLSSRSRECRWSFGE